jgi:hypothetical protein
VNTVHPILNSKYGCWLVNKIPFTSKVEALRYASQHGNPRVYYYFHNHVWEGVDKNTLGKIPLTTLYKERALQLRDKYDYLVLHYSGGSDSHNILHTFLSNNIKLDEVTVRWPKPLVDGKFYTPNTQDKSARNSPSEWNFAIKPTLEYLKQYHPDIKINIVDYGSNLSERFLKIDHIESRIKFNGIARGGLANTVWHVDPKVEGAMAQLKIDSVGHLFGIEKPILYFKDNAIWFQFMDGVWDTAIMPRNKIEEKVEAFYWSPEIPLLPVEQAYQSALWFKVNKEKQKVITERTGMTDADYLKQFADQGEIHKAVLYKESWDMNKFQAGKPNISRSDWFFWLFENPEMLSMRQNWERAMIHIADGIHDSYLTKVTENLKFLRPIHTKLFHLLDLD